MRQKASELIKGEWYCDIPNNFSTPQFFKFERMDSDYEVFSEQKGDDPNYDFEGRIEFRRMIPWFMATPEDIEKYNLNEKE